MTSSICKCCGGDLVGDGYNVVFHCPNVDVVGEGFEPDANPVYCDHWRVGIDSSSVMPDDIDWAGLMPDDI